MIFQHSSPFLLYKVATPPILPTPILPYYLGNSGYLQTLHCMTGIGHTILDRESLLPSSTTHLDQPLSAHVHVGVDRMRFVRLLVKVVLEKY